MNKEEILAKSREENKGKVDERESQILSNASKTGMAVGGVLSFVFLIFSRIIDNPLLGFAAWCMYFSMYGSAHLYRFIKTKEKLQLVQATLSLLFALTVFIAMILWEIKK